jgi:TRAP-type C4-dicarboxylate transport system substrate-binding protein
MKFVRIIGAAAFLLTMSGQAFAADVVLRIGSSNSPQSALGHGLDKVAELVAAAKVGVEVKIFPSGQLGAPEVQVQNVKLGVQDGFFEDLTWWTPYSSDLRVAGVPFAFNGRPHLQKWLQSDAFKKTQDEILKNGGQRVLVSDVLWWRGPYRIMMSDKPVRTLDDVAKIKIRQPAIEPLTRFWGKNGLGGNVVNVGWGDVYLAIRQGVADAVTLPLDLAVSMKFVEVAKNIIITDEFPQILVLGINEGKWKSLNDAQRKAITTALDEAGRSYNKEVSDSEDAWKKELTAAGGVITTLDRKPFVDKVAELNKKFETEGYWRAGLIESVNALR